MAKEIVNVYPKELNCDGYGDLVKCCDCENAMLIKMGGTSCKECGSENLIWCDGDRPEWTIEELKELGIVVVEK